MNVLFGQILFSNSRLLQNMTLLASIFLQRSIVTKQKKFKAQSMYIYEETRQK